MQAPSHQPSQSGATSVEYALVLALIFLVILGAVSAFGQTTAALFVGDWPW